MLKSALNKSTRVSDDEQGTNKPWPEYTISNDEYIVSKYEYTISNFEYTITF